jgi:predicted enzyme related to lactoylglutathione lyase
MAVGRLRRFVVDVNDLAVGEQFWSAVTGLPVDFSALRSGTQGQFSGLGSIETGSVLLQLVQERKTALKNRAHLDIGVDDVPGAVAEVVALGGRVIRSPGVFPEHDPELEWAVVADPFGNEFCLVRDLDRPLRRVDGA